MALALPVMAGQIGHILTGVADSVMVGQLGTVPLAAVSFANSFLVIPLLAGIGIAYGLTPLVAKAHGQGKVAKTGRLLKNALWVNGLVGVLFSLVVFLMEPVAEALHQPRDVINTARGYIGVVGFSIVPFMLFMGYKQFVEGRGDTVTAMRISLIGNGLNVLLNYLLIYGWWGFPEMGMTGAGVATALSRVFMFVAIAWVVHRGPKYAVPMRAFREDRPKRKHSLAILRLGVPSALQYIFEAGAFAAAAFMMGSMGVLPLASHQIAINLASISYMAASGFGATATIRVGHFVGQSDWHTLQHAMVNLFLITLGFMALAGMVFYFGRFALPALYTVDQNTLSLAAELMLIAAFFQLSDGVQVTALGALRGLGDVHVPTLVTFIVYFVITLPAAYYFGLVLNGGAKAVWVALAVGLTLSAVFLTFRFFHRLARHQAEGIGK